ncbi:MAG: hypothetical protein HQL34_05530 [Alphaproteobacteria bacterium]|nr:hypothetical protein [Alphaproteobacteria bacterium]
MTTLSQVRAAIVAKLLSVPGVGQVHDHQPFLKTEAKLRELYVANGLLLGWHVRRIGTRETSPSVGRFVERHLWLIQGVMAFDDSGASELAFDGLIEAIRAAFRADETLSGLVGGTADQEVAGIQVEDSLPVMFCGVLCHSARLTLTTTLYT